MPLPFILVGAAVVAGLTGVGAGLESMSRSEEANEINEEAREIVREAERELKKAQESTSEALTELGRLKLQTCAAELHRFVSIFSTIKNVDVQMRDGFDRSFEPPTIEEIHEMEVIALRAMEVLGGGAVALSTGALAGIAACWGTMAFATASTGTAISSLAGAAATNATLAWLGGGSLAAGGMGMAGGMAVLGGVLTGPALMVGGFMLLAKSSEKRDVARQNRAKAREAAEQMGAAGDALIAIRSLTRQFSREIGAVAERFDQLLDQLDRVVAARGTNASEYSRAEMGIIQQNVLAAQILKKLLEVPLLTEEGTIHPDGARMLGMLHAQGKQQLQGSDQLR